MNAALRAKVIHNVAARAVTCFSHFAALPVCKLPSSSSCWCPVVLWWEFLPAASFSTGSCSFQSPHITFLFRLKLGASELAGESSLPLPLIHFEQL